MADRLLHKSDTFARFRRLAAIATLSSNVQTFLIFLKIKILGY